MQHVVVNTSDLEIIRARQNLLASYGGTLDAKRPSAWVQYGWPEDASFDLLLKAYERTGPGKRAVHSLLDRCWQEPPRIKTPGADKESSWEKKLNKQLKTIRCWAKLRDLDRRNMVGRYAGVIYRIADGQDLDQPAKRGKLVDIKPVYENQLRVEKWDEDQRSETYGEPLMWEYLTQPPGQVDKQAQPFTWIKVHPSRVQIMAEGAVGNFLDGVPLLKAGLNDLIDLEKIRGGSAESFLKNSARTIVLTFDADGSPQALAQTPGQPAVGAADVKDAIEAKTRALNQNIDSSILLQGGEASTLQTAVSNPWPSFEVASSCFCASVGVPFSEVFGQREGKLASDQDQKSMDARCESRRVNEITPVLEEFVTRMQALGWIDQGEFDIEWSPLGAPTDEQKLGNGAKMADINDKNFNAGGGPVFGVAEIRKAAGYEEETPDDLPFLGEGDPGADDGADQATAPAPQPRALRAAA